ncbi:hypothetical protein O181_058311 [Austropuccinia psidii MF-1]|uniref:Uncharacterized protein n=1 Tax=Austropuccinia psidii MF-1 TaxID=1389203 RepID=A0A9Q3EA04_9BASI|nr:hypothetical protein [Austropuccinia psidii MF-1]
MKPQPQGHVLDNPYNQEKIKPDSILENKARSPSQYQDGENMSYPEKEELKKLPEASSWPKFSGTGEYDHMGLMDYIDGLFIDVPSIPDDWITAILNKEFKGHASIWYTEMKEIHGRRNWPWWRSKITQEYRNGTWIWQKTMKRTNIGKYSQFKGSSYKDEQPFKEDFKDKSKERVAEVAKKKNSYHNCGSTDHCANNSPKSKRKVYAIKQFPEEESPTEDSESESISDAIIEQYDEDQDPREEFLVEYQEETQLKIQDIQLESGMQQDTESKSWCKHTQYSKHFLVTKAKGMEYIHGTATKMTPLPKLGETALSNQGKELKKGIREDDIHWTIIKEIIIPYRKGNNRLNPEFVELEDTHIKGFLLGTDYQKMYGIDIYNSKNRHITIGTNKEKKFSLDIYQIYTHDPLEELLNEFREG